MSALKTLNENAAEKVFNKKIKKVGQSGAKWIFFTYFSHLLTGSSNGHIYR
jgi:hypothetical protein